MGLMIKAAIFDMDGLLIDSEPLWFEALREIFGDLGVEYTQEMHVGMMGKGAKNTVDRLYEMHPWEGPSAEQVLDILHERVAELIRQEGELKPGVHQALSVCKDAGLPVAIASASIPEIIDAVVDTLEIREHFDHLYSAVFEPKGKPDPGVFLSVAKHFKVRPEDCLVFEDSPAGVQAAKNARMICVAVPEPENRDNRHIMTADVVLGSLEGFDGKLLASL